MDNNIQLQGARNYEYLQQKERIKKDYRINDPFSSINNPFSSKNKNKCKHLNKSPEKYLSGLNNLKVQTDVGIADWTSFFKTYNKEILNDTVKQQQLQNDQTINKNRNTAISMEKQSNKDIQENDKELLVMVDELETKKKTLRDKKIEYNKLIHSANASSQFKNDKETLYTESTVRFILQILGILIAGGLTYKVSNE